MDISNFTNFLSSSGMTSNFIVWVLFGLVVGIIADILAPNPSAGKLLLTLLLGIIGAAIGGILGSFFFNIDVTTFNVFSVLLAVIGAVVLVFLIRFYNKPSRHIKTRVTKIE